MPITIKTAEEQQKMRVAGRLAGEVLDFIAPHVQAGITTGELDRLCHEYITKVQDAIPAPLNYRGFPKSICTSVNHVVCHGIPGDKVLKNGDIVNIDVTVIKDGFHGDTSMMFHVGEPSIQAKRVSQAAREALLLGIDMVKPGTAEELVEGMTFTIEPMVNAGKRHVKLLGDGWTVVTKDRSPSAQWEHTILVTANGHEVLTARPGGVI